MDVDLNFLNKFENDIFIIRLFCVVILMCIIKYFVGMGLKRMYMYFFDRFKDWDCNFGSCM